MDMKKSLLKKHNFKIKYNNQKNYLINYRLSEIMKVMKNSEKKTEQRNHQRIKI